jgi:tRNA threonylcarbamoyladenosine biosynthesis protein TsaE
LRDAEQFESLGVDEYWNGDAICLIEWADRVADRLPAGTWFLRIEPLGPESRRMVLELPPSAMPGRIDELLQSIGDI